MHKTSNYIRTVVALHNIRDRAKEAAESLQQTNVSERVHDKWAQTRQAVSCNTRRFFAHPSDVSCEYIPEKYNYIFRPKSRWELVLLSGTVCGIELCYAAETAFVMPILLSLGLNIKFVTMIWCLSPLIGFFLTPVLGSISDTCEFKFGRRRPFILLLSAGILFGLIFVPNGHKIGIALGDEPNAGSNLQSYEVTNGTSIINNIKDTEMPLPRETRNTLIAAHGKDGDDFSKITTYKPSKTATGIEFNATYLSLTDVGNVISYHRTLSKRFAGRGSIQTTKDFHLNETSGMHVQPWSIFFTVVGTVLLDFCSDACQSPSRTLLLDVSLPEDHTVGLSTFTLMAGLGGSVGYLIGAVHWETTFWGHILGGQVNAVFMIVTIVFAICLISTLCSFPEIPLPILKDPEVFKEYQKKLKIGDCQEEGSEMGVITNKCVTYGTTSEEIDQAKGSSDLPNGMPQIISLETHDAEEIKSISPDDVAPKSDVNEPTLKEYLRSIIHMPNSLRILCLTNLFCWMSLVCYSLYFTDFVGEVVYGGNPHAAEGSLNYKLYQDGVSFGCWGMALYSFSCSTYSYFIESLVKRFGAKPVYIGGQLVYSAGMVIMAVARHPAAVILLSPTAGIMYSTLFTMPYLLIAHYHCMGKFRDDKSGGECGVRGIGTDVAIVSSMVFLSQFVLSLSMGAIVNAVRSKVATVCAAALLSFCGAVSATQVMYLDM